MQNITIIIRSVNERTEQLCKKLLLEQGISDDSISIVREVPFSASMKRSFEIGIDENNRWTLCVDADVLSRPGAVEKMIGYAENQKENICEIQGYILDKFFGGVRRGGFHLYRTSLLPKVLKCIPQEGVSIRPESHTLDQMRKKGYPRVLVPYVVGTHDEEQYNYDIYRKAYVQAVKHLDRADLLISNWRKNINEDRDFLVALKAFSDSIINTDQLYINSDQDLYKKMFEKTGFEEKDELDVDNYSLDDIEKKINEWGVDERYYDYYPNTQGLDVKPKVAFRKLRLSIQKRGAGRTILLVASQSFMKIGKILERKVSK